MSGQAEWVGKRVAEARAGKSVTEAAVTKMLALVSGQFQDKHLSATELGRIATAFIADMTPPLHPADPNR